MPRHIEINFNRLRAGLLLNSHFYSHNFVTVTDPKCQCGARFQSTEHFLINCPLLLMEREVLLAGLSDLNCLHDFETYTTHRKADFLLNGDENLSIETNENLIEISAHFITQAIQILGQGIF